MIHLDRGGMMKKPALAHFVKDYQPLTILLVALALVTVTLSCSLPFKIVWTGGDSAEKPAAGEVESQPSATQENQAAAASGATETVTVEALPTGTPSLTPSPTITSTPKPIYLTGKVTRNTNCRSGPQDNYELIHVLKKGDTVTLLGKNQEGTFWFVRWQNGDVYECWMWDEYVSADAAADSLPVLTPPPSPVPFLAFVLSYKNTTGETTVNVYLRNSGNIPIASYSATFKDTNTGQSLAKSSDSFGNMASIGVGNITIISSPSFSASTIGHSMTVSVKACTQDGQSGKCSTVSTSFESK
jgi:uncharacterized protein YraI